MTGVCSGFSRAASLFLSHDTIVYLPFWAYCFKSHGASYIVLSGQKPAAAKNSLVGNALLRAVRLFPNNSEQLPIGIYSPDTFRVLAIERNRSSYIYHHHPHPHACRLSRRRTWHRAPEGFRQEEAVQRLRAVGSCLQW